MQFSMASFLLCADSSTARKEHLLYDVKPKKKQQLIFIQNVSTSLPMGNNILLVLNYRMVVVKKCCICKSDLDLTSSKKNLLT